MAQSKQQLFGRIADCGVVAVIRAKSKDQLADLSAALIEGGVIAIEVTMSTPDAIAGIRMLGDRLGDRGIVGVGTVLDVKTARDAIDAGAKFVVSPVFDPEVVAVTLKAGVISIPGAFSPTEVYRVHCSGADVVKVFPATTLGPGYFKDLLAPMPMLKLTPTGGVDAANAGDWIRAGAVFVGAGSSLVTKDALAKNDWSSVASNARAFVSAVRAARGK
jgi:2-dehydro-3-deoxyphosphogluconate aldolase/(4S)-4-hydroxy-2-oxoglutarate aldolase